MCSNYKEYLSIFKLNTDIKLYLNTHNAWMLLLQLMELTSLKLGESSLTGQTAFWITWKEWHPPEINLEALNIHFEHQ